MTLMAKLSHWLTLAWRVSWPETVGSRLVVGAAHLCELANVDDADLQEWRTWARLPVPRRRRPRG